MSKLAKFVSSALNNSSANEAAQALKMAAALMQKEGVNPSDFLQEKGAKADPDTAERLERALAEIENLRNRQSNSADLREAKELAIHWHKVAKDQEADLEESLTAASLYQKGFVSLQAKNETLRKWVKGLAVCCVVGAFAAFGFGNVQGEESGRIKQASVNWDSNYMRDHQISELKAQIETLKANQFAANSKPATEKAPWDKDWTKPAPVAAKPATKETVWHPRGGVYGLTAICKNATKTIRPSFSVNINDSTVKEDTNFLADGYSLNLPANGAPFKGHKFSITTSTNATLNCSVTQSWE